MTGRTQKVTFLISNKKVSASKNESLLEVIRRSGFEVPSLCHHPMLSPYGACRLCLVEVQKGKKRILTTSCNYPAQSGIQIFLDTPRVKAHRKQVLELLSAMAPQSKTIAAFCKKYGVKQKLYPAREPMDNCILCGLCVRVCHEVAETDSLTFENRGKKRRLAKTLFGDFPESCIGCGACEHICPTNAIFMENSAIVRLRQKISTERPCRYALMGLTPGAVCEKDYACAKCEVDQQMIESSQGLHPIFLARGLIDSKGRK